MFVHRYYAGQKKTLEINPRHPLVKELKRRVETDKEDQATLDLANILFETATLRSGYVLKDTASFADRMERMLRRSLDISLDESVSGILLYSHNWNVYISCSIEHIAYIFLKWNVHLVMCLLFT